MAAPQEKNVHDLSGQWKFNRELSDDVTTALAVQGVNLVLRTALSRAPISLFIEQTRDAGTGVEKIKTRQSTVGRNVEEERALNWEEEATAHAVFGMVKTKTRISAVGAIGNELLTMGWEEGTVELIEVQTQGSDWAGWQAWGFEVIHGKRRHVRRTLVQKGTGLEVVAADAVLVKMVYDWVE